MHVIKLLVGPSGYGGAEEASVRLEGAPGPDGDLWLWLADELNGAFGLAHRELRQNPAGALADRNGGR